MQNITNIHAKRIKGAHFVERETNKFLAKVVGGTFTADFVTKTQPALQAKYSRLSAAYKKVHIDTWSGPRGQEIIDNSPTEMFMWNFLSGWCVSEHKRIAILFIWYDCMVECIGLNGPSKAAVVSFAASENRLYHSRTLYTDAEINNFNANVSENVIYLENFVHP